MTEITNADLGWSPFFLGQLSVEDLETYRPARISAVHRGRVEAISEAGPLGLTFSSGIEAAEITVGDWVLVDLEARVRRVLHRKSKLSRRAAGTDAREQLIAANVDTLAVVSSCNADFNLARLERYIVLAADAGCLPLVLLTKADLCENPDTFRRAAEGLSPLVTAFAIDARAEDDLERLTPWCKPGETVALVGSSGVGKTTILNGLTGRSELTKGIREDDAKGRHTTTFRALRRMTSGGWIIDTPGMRALRLADVGDGLDSVFADIEALAGSCRFSDCTHGSEPDCAVLAAIEEHVLDQLRVDEQGLARVPGRRRLALAIRWIEGTRRPRARSRVVRPERWRRRPAHQARTDRRRFSSASMNGSTAPSRTDCGLPTSWLVRWSFTRLS